MGRRIKSLMAAAHAAGYAMAPEDMYLDDDVAEQHVLTPARSTALVSLPAATHNTGLMAQARAAASRYYASAAWLTPRLPA